MSLIKPDPELLISSRDAQVSRSAVAKATFSGALWLGGDTLKPTNGDKSAAITQPVNIKEKHQELENGLKKKGEAFYGHKYDLFINQ